MTKLILVRGASGSGKTTFATKLMMSEVEGVVYETDAYFMRGGEYCFDASQLGRAHAWNLERTRVALTEGLNVAVPNTLTTRKEINQYLKIAEELNIPVEVYRSNARFGNLHGVPDEKVQQMRDRMVDFPGEIIIND